jgi:hypothetical protein
LLPTGLVPVPVSPPQISIFLPVHTAVSCSRGLGAPAVASGRQVRTTGSYMAPSSSGRKFALAPPQISTSFPVQTLLANERALGAPSVGIAVHVLLARS